MCLLPATAYVTGAVKKPTNVAVKENLTVSQAIAMAQGIDPMFATYKITIMRFDEQGRPKRIEANLKDITAGKEADIPVKDNDAIVVNEGELKTKLWVIRQILPIPSGGYSIPTPIIRQKDKRWRYNDVKSIPQYFSGVFESLLPAPFCLHLPPRIFIMR